MDATPPRDVPFFRYPSVFTDDEQAILDIVADVGRRGAFIMQTDLVELEKELAAYVGAKHCVGVANATDGLLIGLRAAGIEPGDKVIFCSHTMVATAAAIHFAGATPVPVDCGEDRLIDPESVRQAITPRTRAIMPTQLNGRTCDMDALQAIADEHGLVIVEDAAQALGSTYKGQAAGTFGAAGAISFYPAKTLGCLGDGGCVFTNDDDVNERLRLLRDHGRNAEGDVVEWAMNTRLDNLQAAILRHKLKSYPAAVERRREIASLYHDRLSSVEELSLPPAPGADPQRFDIFQNYEVEAADRDALRASLRESGVGTLVQWGGKAVHQFEKLGFTQSLPRTEAAFDRLLMLPLNTTVTDEEVHYVCDCVEGFYASQAKKCAAAA
ncbi:MAG: DegT/DnrJ/EryC1/StrS family aminotransferase [Planctomycetota bacterium]